MFKTDTFKMEKVFVKKNCTKFCILSLMEEYKPSKLFGKGSNPLECIIILKPAWWNWYTQ